VRVFSTIILFNSSHPSNVIGKLSLYTLVAGAADHMVVDKGSPCVTVVAGFDHIFSVEEKTQNVCFGDEVGIVNEVD